MSRLNQARDVLIRAGLIAYQRPLYQVLALETHRRPVDMFAEEQAHLRPLNPNSFDIARVETVRVSKKFRVALDSNHYSVPAEYTGRHVTLIYCAELRAARLQLSSNVKHAT